MSSENFNSGSFCGDGEPPRKLFISGNNQRFPITGDSWSDNQSGNIYIFKNNKWVKIPKLPNYENLINIYKKTNPAVVSIVSYDGNGTLPVLFEELKLGSGFYISSNGLIVTTATIVSNTYRIAGMLVKPLVNDLYQFSTAVYVRALPENILVPATIIGVDRKADVALLKVDLNDRNFLNFGNSRESKIGSIAMTIGQANIGYADNINGSIDNSVTFLDLSDQVPALRVIRDNKWHDNTEHRESIVIDYNIDKFAFGGPTINLNGEVIGIASWNELSQDELFLNIGSNSSFLIEPIIDYLKQLPIGVTGTYPAGFFGIAYDYLNSESIIRDTFITGTGNTITNRLNSGTGPNGLNGIQLIRNASLDNNNVRLLFGSINNPLKFINPNPFPDSPASKPIFSGGTALQIGDIILEARANGATSYIPIGNSNERFPFDTIVHLATATGILDIKYLRKSELWQTLHEQTGIGLTGIPNNFDNPLNRFS